MSNSKENVDNHVYRWLMFYPDTLKFFLAALRYYHSRLEEEIRQLQSDALYKELFDEKTLESSEISIEAKKFSRVIKRFEKVINENPNATDYDLEMTHGDIRILKSVGSLYINNLEKRRAELTNNSKLSTVAIQTIDTKLSQLREKVTQGVFETATPWPLLIEDAENFPTIEIPDRQEVKETVIAAPVQIISTIELLDSQLRDRCLDLFHNFSESDQPHRFDTVVTEATRILEDRIRKRSKVKKNISGLKLMSYSFGGENPRLILSDDPAEQDAAHQMFRGVFGLIRNPYHHKIIDSLGRERVLQILGMIDYLIFLTESTKINEKQIE